MVMPNKVPPVLKRYRKTLRQQDPNLQLKIPHALYHDLTKMAAYNHRDVSAEIVARLISTVQCTAVNMPRTVCFFPRKVRR